MNVRGIKKRILEWCKHKQGDIVFLQETYSTPEVEARWRLEMGGSVYFSHGTNHSRGVLMRIAPNMNINVKELNIDEDGRYIIFKGDIQGTKIIFGNVYLPTRDKVKEQINFLDNLEKLISETWSPEYTLVLGGDFNLIMNRNLD